MGLDDQIERLRGDCPTCERLLHFNNAGFALTPRPVLDAVLSHLALEQELGGYEAAESAQGKIDNFHAALARLLACEPSEVAWVENATRAWDMAFYSIPFRKGDLILTGQMEYASNYLAMLQVSQRFGVKVKPLPSTPDGQVCLDALARQLHDNPVRVVALTHVPSHSGVIQPAAEVGRLARSHGAIYLLDACQSAGQLPLDVAQLGCDMLTGTGRKYLRGPRGTGFLYVNRNILERLDPPFIDLHAARWLGESEFEFHPGARRFETWECFTAGKIGLGVAVDYALALGLPAIRQRIGSLATLLIEGLQACDRIKVYEPPRLASGIVTFSKRDEEPARLQQRLRRQGINTGLVRRSSAQLDFARRGIESVNRASLHYYNTEAEIERFLQVLSAQ